MGLGDSSRDARAQGWRWMMKNATIGDGADIEMLQDFWEKYVADKDGHLSKDEIKRILMDLSNAKKQQMEESLSSMNMELTEQVDPTGVMKAMMPMIESEIKHKMTVHEKRASGEIAPEEIDFIFSEMDMRNNGRITKSVFLNSATSALAMEEDAPIVRNMHNEIVKRVLSSCKTSPSEPREATSSKPLPVRSESDASKASNLL